MENLIYILSDFFITFYWMYTIYCLIRYRNSISRPEFIGMLFTSFVIIYSIFDFVFLKERPSSVKQVQWITTNFLFGFTFNMIIRTRRSISKILNNFNKK